CTEGGPQLVSFNERGDGTITSTSDLVQLGSAGVGFQEVTARAVSLVRKATEDPKIRLTCLLALCQTFTVQHYTLEQYFGGAFSGIYVDKDGAHWQPDIGYLLLTPEMLQPTTSKSLAEVG